MAKTLGAGHMPPTGGDATKDKSVEGVGRRRRQANLKLWLRNLTPGISEEQLKELFESLLATNASAGMDWLRLVPASKQVPTATAYLHFKSEEALQAMHTKLDGHKLFDAKGKEFKVLAEYAPYQKIPRKKVIDRREGTIEKDPDYMAFIEEFEQQRSFKIESAEAWLERREQEAAAKAAAGTDGTDKAIFVSTPLLDYVREKRDRLLREKRDQRVREDERRRKVQTEALMRAKAQQQQQLLQQQQQQQQQQQRGAVSARGGRGSRGGGPAAQGPAAVVPQAIAVRPTSAGSRPASAGSSRLGEGQKGAARDVQRNSGGGGRGPGVPSSDESQAQQGRGGSKESMSSKHSSQSEGKGNASGSSQQFYAQQILQRETQVQSAQRPSSSAQEPPARATSVARGGGGGRSAGAGSSAGGIARGGGAGGGGSSSSGISGGGQTDGVASGEGKSDRSKTSARPVGVYKPRPRGGGSGGE
jgi:regulator of nonsense transcripts 3